MAGGSEVENPDVADSEGGDFTDMILTFDFRSEMDIILNVHFSEEEVQDPSF